MRASALALTDISKRFGATLALDRASFDIEPASIHALLGENGAGKTTLMRIAFGLERADSGTITIAGEAVEPTSAREAIARGVCMVQQHFSLVPAMNVAENVALGRGGLFRPREAAARVLALARETGLAIDPFARVADLPIAAQQKVELLKALARDPRVLILDEPTALLAPSEVAELLAVMRRLATAGMALVFITHRLRDALAVADRITVLQQGRTVLSRETTSVSEIDVTAAMFPADVPLDVGRPSAHTRRDRIASLDNVDVQDESGRVRLRSATLEVYGGEIIGVAGVEGSGYHELLGALGGRLVTNRGSAQRPDRVAFIPEHRLRDALIPAFSLTENVALRESGARRGRMKWNELTPESEELVASFGIRAASVDSPAFTLSGGNQQKLVLARELGANPSLVVAENPTQGLDLRASASIRAHLRAARDAGAAVVLYSSDLEELLALADRIVVTFNGTMVEVPVDAEAVGRQMIGA